VTMFPVRPESDVQRHPQGSELVVVFPGNPRQDMIKEYLPPPAQITQPSLARPGGQDARTRAFAPAKLQMAAVAALPRKRVVLVEAEFQLFEGKHHLTNRLLSDITDLVFRL
jgi:hypothetical protein